MSGKRSVCVLLLLILFAPAQEPFAIHVIDRVTKRGVPLIELETTGGIRFVTDSAGVVAFREPGLLGTKVWFHVRGHGYRYPEDGFGFRGVALETRSGGHATIRVDRVNVAERLYRITGGGIYRDSILTGRRPPSPRALLNGRVAGQDSVQAVPFGERVLWFWGDTHRVRYPLGLFKTAGAWSPLPGKGGLTAVTGVELRYFTGKDGFARAMCPIEGPGVVWIDGVTVVEGTVVCHYSRRKSLTEETENGLARWNPRREVFEKWVELPLGEKRHLKHHPNVVEMDGESWVVLGSPFPELRVRADLKSVGDPACHQRWNGTSWVAAEKGYRPVQQGIASVGGERQVQARPGTVRWNAHRNRWIAIFGEAFGESSFLGEVWMADAPAITGPWKDARKIVTHDGYSFYNVAHHGFLDDGRHIYFEGTYTTLFSKTKVRTPRYDYNQIMYRLDLDDPRLR